MKQEINHIPSDLKIAKKLEQLNLQPSAGLWDRIEAQLDKEAATILVPWYQQHIAGVAGLIVGILILGLSYENNQIDNIVSLENNINSNEILSVEHKAKEQFQADIQPNISSKLNDATNHSVSSAGESNTKIASVEKTDQVIANKSNHRSKHKKSKFNQNNQSNLTFAIKNTAVPEKQKEKEQYFVSRNNETIMLEVIGEKNIPLALTEQAELIGDENQPDIEFKKQKTKPVIKGFYTGIDAGVNISKLFYSEKSQNPLFNQSINLKLDMGINYGLVLGYDFNNKFGIQSGFKYSRYNQKFSQPFSDYTLNGTMSIFQFDMPLLMKYRIAMVVGKKPKPLVFSMLAGIQYSYLHHYYLIGDLQSNTINQTAKIEAQDKQNYNLHQLSYLIGFETKYFISKNWSMHASIFGNLASDISQFPIFVNNDFVNPIQLSTSFLMGFQYHFNRKKDKKTTK